MSEFEIKSGHTSNTAAPAETHTADARVCEGTQAGANPEPTEGLQDDPKPEGLAPENHDAALIGAPGMNGDQVLELAEPSCEATASADVSAIEPGEGAPAGPEVPAAAISEPKRTRHTSAVGSFMATMQSLAITVAIAVFVITFIVQAFQIPSESMENTLLIGDYLLVDKIHYGPNGVWGHLEPYEKIRRGDIIVFKYPVNPTQHFVKRVIGVPGDRVRLINKRVYVNGRPQNEPYVVYSRPFSEYPDNFPVPGMIDPNMEMTWYIELHKLVEGRELIVPEDSYFVLGDNRDKSLDSRYWGFVPRENVVGRPLLIYFSMRKPIEVTTRLSSFSDKVHDLTYNLTDLSGRIRWRRAFRLIK
jgi:signal peptidase I